MEQPGQTVHEGVDFLPVGDACVAHYRAGDIDGKVAVAVHQVGEGKGDEHQAQQQDGIEGTVGQVETVEQPGGEAAEGIADDPSEEELDEEVAGDESGTQLAAGGEHLDEDDGQHVGHRVVTAAFQFQHGTEVVLEVHLLRAEQVEHRGGVGGRHGGGQQQRGGERERHVGGYRNNL